MIGGMMLLCAVSAMVVLAAWSLARDDDPDTRARDGLLALRSWPARKPTRQEARRAAQSSRRPSGQRSTNPKRRSKPPEAQEKGFDQDEMAKIAKEIDETLPDFIRMAQENR